MLDNEKFDKLIEEAIKEEIESVNVTDEEIQEEWVKLEKSLKRNNNRTLYKKLTLVVAAVIVFLLIPIVTDYSYSWKIFKIFNIKSMDNKDVISEISSINDNIKENSSNQTSMNINDAKNIINFRFKELPYEVEDITVIGRKKIVINYKTEKGPIEFNQKLQGIESNNTINVSKNNKIEKFKFNSMEYTYINIDDKITKLVWSDNGIKSTLNIYYSIELEEAKNFIKKIK